MLIITDVESVLTNAKKGFTDKLGAKDKIYCFNKNGRMVDIDFINIVNNIKAPFKIIPGEISAVQAGFLIGSEKQDSVTILLQSELDVADEINEIMEFADRKINFTSKIGSTQPQAKKKAMKEKKAPVIEEKKEDTSAEEPEEDLFTTETNDLISEETEDENKSDDDIILDFCHKSKITVFKEIAADKNLLNNLKSAIYDSSDCEIGFPMVLGMKIGRDKANAILSEAKILYKKIKPSER